MSRQGVSLPWNLHRLKACLGEAETSVMKGRDPAPAHAVALGEMANLPADLRARAAKESGRVAGHVMMALLRGAKVAPDGAERLARALEPYGADAGMARDLAAYLTTAQAIQAHMAKTRLDRADLVALAAAQADLMQIVAQGRARFGDLAALNLLKGAVASLTDRDTAAALFRAGTAAGHDAMATSVFDLGAHTYFSDAEIGAAASVDDGCAVAVRQAMADAAPQKHGVTADLVWSVDVGFLQIYGPYWFNLAPYLLREGLGLVMAVIGPAAEVEAAIDESREMIVRLARFHRLPDAEAVARAFVFVPMTTPAGLGEAKTFYACARHLMAPEVMATTGRPVLLLDADFSLHDPMAPFIAKLAGSQVGVVQVAGMTALWPWRRNTAANGWFTPTDLGRSFLSDMGDYIRAGLNRDPSWTLDQNALTYALERHVDTGVLNVGALSRPTSQDKIRSLFEKAWRDERTG